jgi:hypothetical protein
MTIYEIGRFFATVIRKPARSQDLAPAVEIAVSDEIVGLAPCNEPTA